VGELAAIPCLARGASYTRSSSVVPTIRTAAGARNGGCTTRWTQYDEHRTLVATDDETSSLRQDLNLAKVGVEGSNPFARSRA
jgi:hypothetical protein